VFFLKDLAAQGVWANGEPGIEKRQQGCWRHWAKLAILPKMYFTIELYFVKENWRSASEVKELSWVQRQWQCDEYEGGLGARRNLKQVWGLKGVELTGLEFHPYSRRLPLTD
jgi:hypothetical protein